MTTKRGSAAEFAKWCEEEFGGEPAGLWSAWDAGWHASAQPRWIASHKLSNGYWCCGQHALHHDEDECKTCIRLNRVPDAPEGDQS